VKLLEILVYKWWMILLFQAIIFLRISWFLIYSITLSTCSIKFHKKSHRLESPLESQHQVLLIFLLWKILHHHSGMKWNVIRYLFKYMYVTFPRKIPAGIPLIALCQVNCSCWLITQYSFGSPLYSRFYSSLSCMSPFTFSYLCRLRWC